MGGEKNKNPTETMALRYTRASDHLAAELGPKARLSRQGETANITWEHSESFEIPAY